MAGENAAGKRVIGKPVAGILLCIAVAASSSSVSLAGSPEFAYTAEQWASFRDNKSLRKESKVVQTKKQL